MARPAGGQGQVGRSMPDGLYQVVAGSLCAGVVIKGGVVIACAPVLRRRLAYWLMLAVRIADV